MTVKIVDYFIDVIDVMRDSKFSIHCDSETELKERYEKYKKDTDYEIISIHSMLTEVRPIEEEWFKKPIM